MLTLGSTASAVVTAAFLVGMVVIVVAVADMIVIKMHNDRSFEFFFYYSAGKSVCQNIYFFTKIPREGLRNPLAGSIIVQNICSARTRTDHYRKRAFSMPEHTHEPIPDHTHDHCEEAHDHAYLHAHGIAHTHGHVHENQKAVLNRLSRAIGHLEKVKRMVESGEDCSEVLIQLAAVRSALDNTGKVILKDHMRHCMVDAVAAGDQTAIDDLCAAIDKFMK